MAKITNDQYQQAMEKMLIEAEKHESIKKMMDDFEQKGLIKLVDFQHLAPPLFANMLLIINFRINQINELREV